MPTVETTNERPAFKGTIGRLLNKGVSKYRMLILLTLVVSGLFKLSSFAREAVIASRFGVSPVTDAYFGLQQLPLTFASFMFGAFSLAFSPAYSKSRKEQGYVDWLPGLLTYGLMFSLVLTAATIALSPLISGMFVHSSQPETRATLVILSSCYLPIVAIGIWGGASIARGRNLLAMIVTGAPYLLMTVALLLSGVGKAPATLDLPISMAVGFGGVGLISIIGIFVSETLSGRASTLLRPWLLPGFKGLTSRLPAACVENAGATANVMLMLYFLAKAGPGAVSSNSCAMRIAMLGYTLLVLPLAQLMQARLCTISEKEWSRTMRTYLTGMVLLTGTLAVVVVSFRYPVIALIYKRGKFSGAAVAQVASMLPPWLAYFVMLSSNTVMARFMYTSGMSTRYMRNLLCGYATSTVLRFLVAGSMPAPWIMWAAFVGEGSAFSLNVLSCMGKVRTQTGESPETLETSAMENGTSRRVLMVITSLVVGGAESQVVGLAQQLRARNWDVAVVCLLGPGFFGGILEKEGIQVYSLAMQRRIPDPRALLKLAGIIRQWKPGIVHSHMVHANLLTRMTRLLVKMPVLICTAHNTREVSVRGGPTWYKELLYRVTDRLTDCTTIICKAGFRHYVATKAVPEDRLRLIPTAVDTQRFAPDPIRRKEGRDELGLQEDEFAFLAVGRLAVQKDYPNLLRAAARLTREKWRLFIAGEGPLKEELNQLTAQLSLAEKVAFLGVKQDVRKWFNAADGFVMSSAMEGLPVALLEASASGLPGVVTDVGGNSEVVIDGMTGFVVPPHDSGALHQALEKMMQMPRSRLQDFSAAARAHCQENFEVASVVSRWEDLYREYLSGNEALQPDIDATLSASENLRALSSHVKESGATSIETIHEDKTG